MADVVRTNTLQRWWNMLETWERFFWKKNVSNRATQAAKGGGPLVSRRWSANSLLVWCSCLGAILHGLQHLTHQGSFLKAKIAMTHLVRCPARNGEEKTLPVRKLWTFYQRVSDTIRICGLDWFKKIVVFHVPNAKMGCLKIIQIDYQHQQVGVRHGVLGIFGIIIPTHQPCWFISRYIPILG
jgi:hypothetical protein